MNSVSKSDGTRRRYELFGSIGSPYALKLRSILRYQRAPFDWVPASLDWIPERLSHPPRSQNANARIAHVVPPVLPVVYFPKDQRFRNDSTLVAEALDKEFAGREIVPPDSAVAFLSHLLEDMSDEWGVKIAFQYRWGNGVDRTFKSPIVTGELLGGGFDQDTRARAARHFAERQVGRMPLVGCTEENKALIVETFHRILAAIGRLQESTSFLFGARPLLADFGWYGQLASLADDPTPREIMRCMAPGSFIFLQMLEDASGVDEAWPSSPMAVPEPTRELLQLAGEVYLPFLYANERAFAAGEKHFSFTALGRSYAQVTFKYQVKCLQWLRAEYARLAADERDRVNAILERTNCLEGLTS